VAIDVRSLKVTYGSTDAVRDVSLGVDFGEVAALLGPNGAGKTSTVETLLGFREPTGGEVFLHGLNPRQQHREVVARTGALLQRGGVWSPMSPLAVLKLTATYYSAPRDVHELIDLLDLGRCATTSWRRLSGGEQQRTLLALALLGRPKVLVLDEPTAGVDPEGRAVIRELVRTERDRGAAILLTTHDLADVEAVADHVTIMVRGAVRAAGTVAELTADYGTVVDVDGPVSADELSRVLGTPIEILAPTRWRVTDDTAAAALPAALAAAGGRLVALRSRATLEERYLELVKEEDA